MPCGDDVDAGGGRLVNLPQDLATALGHRHQPGRARDQLPHDPPLLGAGLPQERVQRGHHGHAQFSQERQQVAAGRPAVDAELMLHADDVRAAEVEEIRRAPVGSQVLLLDLEANRVRIRVATRQIVHRHRETLALGVLGRHRGEHIRGKGGDAAFPRQVVAQKGYLTNVRSSFHRLSALLSGNRRDSSMG